MVLYALWWGSSMNWYVCLLCCSRVGYIVGLHFRVLDLYWIFCASVSLHYGPFIALYKTLYFCFLLNLKIHVLHVQYEFARNTTNAFCAYLTIVVFFSLPCVSRPRACTFGTSFTKLTSIIISYSRAHTTNIVYSPTNLIISSWCVHFYVIDTIRVCILNS